MLICEDENNNVKKVMKILFLCLEPSETNIEEKLIIAKEFLKYKYQKLNVIDLPRPYLGYLSILFDITKIKTHLNKDICNHINKFVGKKFIQNIRVLLIQEKWFPNTNIIQMLSQWSLKNLLKLEEMHIYLKYNFSNIYENNWYDYEIDNPDYYLNTIEIREMFVRPINHNQTNQTIIERIFEQNDVVNCFAFQRTVATLTKFFVKKN